MASYFVGKIKMKAHVVRPQPRNEECKRVAYIAGHVVECGAPTKGHTYCTKCEAARSVQPCGSRYSQFSGPAFGFSRKSGAAA